MSRNRFEVGFGRAASAGARGAADPDQPLRVLLVTHGDATRGNRPVRITRDDAESTLAGVTPAAPVSVTVLGEPERVTVAVGALDDLDPENLLARIGSAARLDDLGRRLGVASQAEAAARELTTLLGGGGDQPAEPPAAGNPDDFTRLIGGDSRTRNHNPEAERVRSFISDVLRDGDATADYTSLAARVAEAAHDPVRQLLADPAFRAVERLWRGVDWLVTHVDLDAAVELWLLPLDFEALGAELEGTLPERLTAVTAGAGEGGFAVIAVDHEIRTAADVTLLERFCRLAESLDATVLARAPDALLDDDNPLRALRSEPADPAVREAWSAFRRGATAQRCAAVLPRLLLRLPYGRRGEACGLAGFEELGARPRHEDFLWGSPVYGLLLLLCERFEAEGWNAELDGELLLEDMPYALFDDGSGDDIKPAAETYLSEQHVAALRANGVMTLQSYRNRNAVLLAGYHHVA